MMADDVAICLAQAVRVCRRARISQWRACGGAYAPSLTSAARASAFD